jgi:hypothetical protein
MRQNPEIIQVAQRVAGDAFWIESAASFYVLEKLRVHVPRFVLITGKYKVERRAIARVTVNIKATSVRLCKLASNI